MKFVIAIALIFVLQSVSAQRFSSGDSSKRTSCTYFNDKLTLSCKGPSGTVECDALSIFPMTFKIAGLGLDSTFTGKNIFRLFPLRQDNTVWINHQFLTEAQNKISLSVHDSTTATADDSGLRIKDTACFNKLAELFKSSESNMIVPLAKLTGQNIETIPTARLFGQVFFFDKSFSTIKTA